MLNARNPRGMTHTRRSSVRVVACAALVACLSTAMPASHAALVDAVTPAQAGQDTASFTALTLDASTTGALIKVKVPSQRNLHPAPPPPNQPARGAHHA
jgi:hypothetical protein